MRRVPRGPDSPGQFLLLDGEEVCGVWLRLSYQAEGEEAGATPGADRDASFLDQPASFKEILELLLEVALESGVPPRGPFLLVVEWAAELMVRAAWGQAFAGKPALRSALAVCRVVREGDYSGSPALVVRQATAADLRGPRQAGPEPWLRELLHGSKTAAALQRSPTDVVWLPTSVCEPLPREGLLLPGFFDRQLRYQAASSDAVVLRRSLSAPVALLLGLRFGGATLGLALILGFLWAAVSLRIHASGAADPPHPAVLADLPVGPCSMASAPFLLALRCQIDQLARRDTLDPACAAAASLSPTDVDLAADLCGLLDRSADGRFAALVPGKTTAMRDYGELALSQACFDVMGSPESYAVKTEDAVLAWGDPDRLLRGEDAIGSLQDVETQVLARCTENAEHLRAYVSGAVLAAHVGAPRATGDLPSAAQDVAISALTDADRPCFRAGEGGSANAATYDDLCGGATSSGGALASLQGVPEGAVVNRYLRARYGTDLGTIQPKDGLWQCHVLLDGDQSPAGGSPVAGAWTFPVTVLSAYAAGPAVQSELGLNAALVGGREGIDLGVCWGEVGQMLESFPVVYPLLGALDPKGWPAEGQQLCGQICRATYGLAPSTAKRLTPDADLSACLSPGGPAGGGAGFPALALPWNGQTGATPPSSSSGAWARPSAEQICAFHLVTQGALDFGRKDWMPSGLTGLSWAGEAATGVAGGSDGAAAVAAAGFAGARTDSRAGALECGAVALQCFAGLAMEVAGTGGRARWADRFNASVVQLSREDAASVARREPWCGLVAPWLATRPLTEQIDATCREGVASARTGIAGALAAAGSTP